MFIANTMLSDGQTLLVLGLSRENRRRLDLGQPIYVSREQHGVAVPAGLKLVIFTGETEAEMAESMASLIGPTTVVGQKKPQ